MDKILEKIDALKAALDALLPMQPEYQAKLDKKIRLEFNYNSNHLEGNTLTYQETELLLYFDETNANHSMRELEEMKAHDVAFQLVQNWAKDPRPIHETDIRNLHKVLLVRPFWKDAVTIDGQETRRQIEVGDYKKYPNSVRLSTGEIFEYASPEETPVKMSELMDWYKKWEDQGTEHAVEVAALFHYHFVRIHPFDDGNGRLSRLLMNYILLRNGFPPVIVKSKDKKNYLGALRRADTGDEAAFIRYIGEQLIWSLELALNASKGYDISEVDDLDKQLAILERNLKNTPTASAPASPEHIQFAINETVEKLFKEIEAVLKRFEDLFFERKRQLVPFMKDASNSLILNNDEDDWVLLTTWVDSEIVGKRKQIGQLTYTYDLNGFKGNLLGQSLQILIRMTFDPYSFSINKDVFPYGQHLNEFQLQPILQEIKLYIINRISQLSKTE